MGGNTQTQSIVMRSEKKSDFNNKKFNLKGHIEKEDLMSQLRRVRECYNLDCEESNEKMDDYEDKKEKIEDNWEQVLAEKMEKVQNEMHSSRDNEQKRQSLFTSSPKLNVSYLALENKENKS